MISIKTFVFYSIFIYMNIVAGLFVTYGLFPDNTFFLLIGIIICIVFYNLKINIPLFVSILFILYLLLNSMYYNSSLSSILRYFAFIIFPYLAYYIVSINKETIVKYRFKNILLLVAFIQIPFLLIQIIYYDLLKLYTIVEIVREDFTVGTFWMRNDPALNFFLILMVNLIMYDKIYIKNLIKNKYKYIIIFIITMSLSNSKLSLLILIISIVIYISDIEKLKLFFRKYILHLPFILVGLYILYSILRLKIEIMFSRMTNISPSAIENFYQGEYSRAAAVLYFLENPINLFGDGIGKYVDLSTMTYYLGLHGQTLMFYAEIGLFGLILSFLFIYYLSKNLVGKLNKLHYTLMFILFAFTLTARPFSDLSIILNYFIGIYLASNKINTITLWKKI